MPESKPAAALDDENRLYVWMDVGHVNNLPDDTRIQNGHVAVDAVTGLVLADQPDYPVHEVPEPEPEPPAEPAAKSSKS